MKKLTYLAIYLTAMWISSAQETAQKAVKNVDQNLVEMDPFTVTASDTSEGYRMANTLAGTRLNTEIRDLGASISVMTRAFFDDTGATDGNSALSYGLNMEVGGTQGNFAGGSFSSTRSDQDAERINPQNGQRARGLASASLTRDFFLTDIPFDTYNTEAVTINRGPNSLLFGIGSPAGVVDSGLKKAKLTADSYELETRINSRGGHRVAIDSNKVIFAERAAIRVAILDDRTIYKQRPAKSHDSRLFLALNAEPFRNAGSTILGPVRIKAHYERGDIKSTPPNVIPPGDSISDWFRVPEPGLATFAQLPAWATNGIFVPKFTVNTLPGLPLTINGSTANPFNWHLALHYSDPGRDANLGSGLAGGQGRIVYVRSRDRRGRFDLYQTNNIIGTLAVPGFVVPVIKDRTIFDNQNLLLSGTSNSVERDFDARNLTLSQTYLKGYAGIEFAFDRQRYNVESRLPFSTGQTSASNGAGDLGIDVSEFLGNDMPNPNLGRPMVKDGPLGARDLGTNDREVLQATAFLNVDFEKIRKGMGWLGRHVFTGLLSYQTINTESRGYMLAWTSDKINTNAVLDARPTEGRSQVRGVVYLGPSLLGSNVRSPADVRITEVVNIPMPRAGSAYKMFYYDPSSLSLKEGDFTAEEFLSNGNIGKQTVESQVFSWQMRLVRDHLIGLVGWRTDKTQSFERLGIVRLPTGPFDPANLQLRPETAFSAEGDTFVWSVVGHAPRLWTRHLPLHSGISVHFNSAENFQADRVRRNVRGETLQPPQGLTEEYGFTIELLDRRLSLRANWYTTSSIGIGTSVGGAASSANGAIQTLLRRWQSTEESGLSIGEALAFTAPSKVGMFSSYKDLYSALIGVLPAEQISLLNPRIEGGVWTLDPIQGVTATTSFVARGFELDFGGQLSPNWRIALNVGKQETVQSDTAPVLKELAYRIRDNLVSSGLGALYDSADRLETTTSLTRYNQVVLTPLAADLARDGTVRQEQRKWRVNVMTNYRFAGGRLRNVGIGGAIRWQDKVATGYPFLPMDVLGVRIPDTSQPFLGRAEFNGDFWLSYRRNLGERVAWKVQLNVRNAISSDDYIPVTTNPDGNVAIVRNPPPREIFLTNTFSF